MKKIVKRASRRNQSHTGAENQDLQDDRHLPICPNFYLCHNKALYDKGERVYDW